MTHSAQLTINLAAIASNWHLLGTKAQSAECGAVVKANAYGCGMKQVVPALLKAGCKTFFVAHLSEGIVLRKIDRQAIIYVFNGLAPGSAKDFKDNNIRPVLNSPEEVHEWLGAFSNPPPYAIHFDTGMNRLGIKPQQVDELPDCEPALVTSHFVESEKMDSAINQKQIDLFENMRAMFPLSNASMANSSAIFLKQQPYFDLARPGVALYGANPTPATPNPMQNVVTLQAPVLTVKTIHVGETAGYCGIWAAKRDTCLITLPVGYGDGFLISGSNTGDNSGAQIFWDGANYPVIGRISMDTMIVDVTDAKNPPQRGDMVEIIGENLPVDTVAASLKTIAYEVLTGLGQRYERHYI
ncbi:MAG: alanine racemase [Pseudomonadota bacterium]